MNLTLYQLNNLVRQVVDYSLNDTYWVEAELAECRESGGHCYMDLIQKDEDALVARAQARCWRSTWSYVLPKFMKITGERPHPGMKVLLLVKAQFHEAYGFSWIVQDIDPNYTLGDMARQRQEIIQTLKREGIFDLNKSLEIPMFAQRIAVISSQTAAGYGDFCNQLLNNEYGFQFTTRLFPAVMQGEQVEETIIAALNKINDSIEDYDVVVIIRGGGATSDFSGFDTLELAENVANFPLPIITGIGHDRDECILDMISCVRVKTPTAAATWLIDNLLETLERIEDASRRITDYVRSRMEQEKLRLSRIQSFLPVAFSLKKTREEAKLANISTRLQTSVTQVINIEKNRISTIEQRLPLIISNRLERASYKLDMLAQRTNAVDPIHILRRGYSIALHDGIAIKDPKTLKKGDEVTIVLASGAIETIVK
ncbi:MAG: exodeoxyribonuclease VII large subunit [Prevotellaceae bacterium]|nr:exodeoxyribonuclease VII large subunit [Prevotellaceae bacterium]